MSICGQSLSRKELSELQKLFRSFECVKLVYLFGSRATGKADAASDFDFAVYVDPKNKKNAFDVLLQLSATIASVLKSDNYDVVLINLIDNLFLKNNIVNDGIVIYEKPGFRLNLELSIVGEYRDFVILEKQYYKD